MQTMRKLPPGFYERLITQALSSRIEKHHTSETIHEAQLNPEHVADRVALYAGQLIERALSDVNEKDRRKVAAEISRVLVRHLNALDGSDDVDREELIEPLRILRSVLPVNPDGSARALEAPLASLLDTVLLTNSPDEPRVGRQLISEFDSADHVDVIMAFIRRTGIRPFTNAMQRHIDRGRELRILTTTYTNSTEAQALEDLISLGADVRVSYDESSTRLHAKAWTFHRESGLSTAYLGSSNLTHAAQVTGLEWNVRLSSARNAHVIEKMKVVFDSYWHSGDFVPYDASEFARRTQRSSDTTVTVPIDLHPLPYQQRMLEQLELERAKGRHRNLLVSATGTGKTVMAALDYKQLTGKIPRARLLFVAHRKELLVQARNTFRIATSNQAFGELWVDGERPKDFDHVFASIQSLARTGYEHLSSEHFDVVIIDEFHHAAAQSYEALLHHLKPKELVGMTATPERSDGLSILHWFDNRIAAELRLWDAIDHHRLVPFAYYGIHDGTDLTKLPWKRGRGYDVEALENVYTTNDLWANLVINNVVNYAPTAENLKAIGFCVSIEHARYMASRFSNAGIPSVAVWSQTSASEREDALKRLSSGEIQVVFAVDLFNEGVDIPSVNTLLMLRPTDSPVLFQQQLGRGLRKSSGKSICTVLDFVGQHHKEFRMDRKLSTLLRGTRQDIHKAVSEGFPHLPAGCHMELDAVAKEIVLDNLKKTVSTRWTSWISELQQLNRIVQRDVALHEFIEYTGIELEDLYRNQRSWSELKRDAGLDTAAPGPTERLLLAASGRLLHVDDEIRIDAYKSLLRTIESGVPASELLRQLNQTNRRLLRMLLASLFDQVITKHERLHETVQRLQEHPQVIREALELLSLLREKVTHVTRPLDTHPEVPLQIHARYTRIEMLAAFGEGEAEPHQTATKITPWQSGVKWLPNVRSDLLTITMDKTDDAFSPTTRYKDYAISPSLLHWESQSITRENSGTGLRYRNHALQGSHVMFFARHHKSERAYYFLGPATYASHKGEKPMAVKWELKHPLPADLFTSLAAAVA